ncbi:MAG: glycosyltransferase family 9 protein [bacterium]|nr:MAG: glycosyltransferase family 9 protein [bacterium]
MQEYEQGINPLSRLCWYILRTFGKGKQFIVPAGIRQSSKLLFIDSGDITDLLYAAPIVNYFKSYYPVIKTTILARNEDVELVKAIMKVNRIIMYNRNQLRMFKTDYLALIRKLRRQNIETAILLGRRFSLERFLLAFGCGARIRIGFTHPLAFPFVNCEMRFAENGYEGDKIKGVLRLVGPKMHESLKEVSLSSKETNHARQLIHFRKPEKDLLTVGIDPSRGKTRHRITPGNIAYLANNLASRRKVKFLILANPWEEKLVGKLAEEIKGEIFDLKPANAKEAVSLLSQCDLFISGNTNLFHFAAALHVPTIGLFTKYDDRRWVPEGAEKVRILKGASGEKLKLKNFFTLVEEVLSTRNTVTV